MILDSNRKNIPPFQFVKKFDIDKLSECINKLDLLNRDKWYNLNFHEDSQGKFANITNKHSEYYSKWFEFKTGKYQDLFLNKIDYELINFNSPESFSSNKSRVKVLKDSNLLRAQNNAEFIFKPILKDCFKDTYIADVYQEISTLFPGGAGRAKIGFMAANSVVESHIDADSALILKVHIPLITDPRIEFISKYKGKNVNYHMQSDGSAILLNVGIPHSVINPTSIDRYHLIINVYNFN